MSKHEYFYRNNSSCLIFCIVDIPSIRDNKLNRPLKMKCSSNQGGIRCNNTCGPIFGGKEGDSDLVIDDNSNRNNKSFSYFGHYYIHPDYEYKSDKANSFLAGTHNFKVLEIEVYTTN